jgi:poly(A) polymerase
MTRALNKNKKPKTNNKNRACNYFLGSFGSPCSFCAPHSPLPVGASLLAKNLRTLPGICM